MNEVPENQPLWTKEFIGTTLSNFFIWTSLQMLVPTMPAYIQHLGGNEFSAGLVTSIFSIAAMFARPFTGMALDRIGRRNILLAGFIPIILAIVGYYGLATVWIILVIRFLQGLGWGMTVTTINTMISELIPPRRRGEGVGYFGLSTNLAMALAPLIGIWLMNRFSYGMLFLFSIVSALLSLGCSQAIRIPQPEFRREQVGQSSIWSGMFEKRAFFPALLVHFFMITFGGVLGFITLFGKEAGIANVGWFFLANALFIMLVRPFTGMVFDRYGPAWVLVPGACLCMLGMFLLSCSTNLLYLVIAGSVYGIGFGAVQPSLQAWMINRVAPHRRGAATATYLCAIDIGIGIGALALGGIAKITSYATMYRLSMLPMALFLFIYVWYLIKTSRKQSVACESSSTS
jgi:MFS family permease